ncbi:MAG: acetyl-CoA carboxylase [Gammaproteobacteria bacterium]|jgi:acetyl-CoA carboxylase biotin carboxyl carrier protein|nr:acetyl-CoA carboxylase [Gammaproteobacteria bacterium]|tara:strand:- start:554 stop:712 length:159 start_codon:yes stop_codon:yes gene_type:complete
MDIRKIKTLIEMLEESNLKEIEVSQGDESVRISKQSDDIKVDKDNSSPDKTD